MNGKTSRSMRSHHGLYEVHLPVTDLDRAIEFYVEKLGFELGFGERGGSSALLLFADGEMRSSAAASPVVSSAAATRSRTSRSRPFG